MKKIYILIGALAVTSASFAQEQIIGKVNASKIGTLTKSTNSPLQKTTALNANDTIGWNNTSADILPEFAANNVITRFGYTGGGSVFGANVGGLNMCAAGFINVNQAPLAIEKVIFSVYEKHQTSVGNASKLNVGLYSMAANKAYNETAPSATTSAQNSEGPNVLLSLTTVSFSAVDTTTSPAAMRSHFTVATFSAPVSVNGMDFAVSIDARAAAAAGDTLGLLVDEDDPNNTLDMTFHFRTNGRWYVSDYLFGGLKANIAIFPIVSAFTAVKEYVNGVKLSALYPNPTKDVATISYSLEKVSNNVSLVVFTLNGQKVYNEDFGTQPAGDYKINLDASSFAAGSYFYQLKSNGSVLTKEFIVTK